MTWMAVAYRHGERREVWSEQRRFKLPAMPGCEGRPKLLYTRRSAPQRWEVVGVYCPECGAAVVEADGS